MYSLFFKRLSQSNFIDNRLIFVCYDIPRSLIHKPKQVHYTCNWFTFSLAYILYISLTAYRVPRSWLLRQLALLYLSLTTCRVASYAEVSSSGRVFCSYSIASLDMGAKKQYSSINFLRGFIEGIWIVNFCGRFLHCCFWLRGKLVEYLSGDRWITSETLIHEVQNANRHCTGHATMSTERGNYRLITVHAPFLAITPNQNPSASVVLKPKSLNSGRYFSMEFYQKNCTYMCHTLPIYSPQKVPLWPLSQTGFANSQTKFRFRFFSKKKTPKPTQSATIVLTLWIHRTEDELQSCILVWRDSKKRRVNCN